MSNSWEDIPASSGGSGSNASVGTNGASAPGSSTQIAFSNNSGNLTPVSPTNPLPVDIHIDSVTVSENLAQVNGVTVATSGSGVQKVGVVGNAGATVDSAAGTPNSQAITVQGNSSGVAVPISGSVGVSGNVTVVQPTGSSLHVDVDNFPATQVVTQSTASSLNATVVGAGTAGSPSGGVVTVQGAASGQALPISGTVIAQQGTASSLNATVVGTGTFAVQNTQQGTASQNLAQVGGSAISIGQQLSAASMPVVLPAAQITTLTPPTTVTVQQPTAASLNATVVQSSGSNLHVNVDNFPSETNVNVNEINGSAVVTAATGVQKVGIVGNSGSSVDSSPGASAASAITIQGSASGVAVPVSVSSISTPTDTFGTGTIGALNAAVTITTHGVGSLILEIGSGLSGTVVVEASNDSFATVSLRKMFVGSSLVNTGATSAGYYRVVGISSYLQIRARCSAYTSGSATVSLNASSGNDTSTPINTTPGSLMFNVIDSAGAVAGPMVASGGTNYLPVASAVPTTPLNGQTTSTGTAVALGSGALVNGVIIQALQANTQNVYIGATGVTTSTGFQLQPGQATSVAVSNLSAIFVISTHSGDGVCYVGS